MYKLSITVLLVLILLPFNIFCQTEDDASHCITLENLLLMVNPQTNHDSDSTVVKLMHEKGYQWSSDTISSEYSCNDITLQYKSASVFYDNVNWNSPAVVIFASADGLCNIVKMKLSKSLCPISMRTEFDNNKFYPSNGGQNYHGHLMIDGKPNYYEIDYYEDSTSVELTFRNKGEIEEFTKKLARKMENSIYAKMETANKLCSAKQFNDAYLVIDSAMGLFAPMDSTLFDLRKKIRNSQIHFLYEKLSEAVNKSNNISEGISLCNEILVLDNQNDSVNEIRRVLIGATKKEYQPYSKLNPVGYNSVIASLENIVNNEIISNPSIQKQTLNIDFTFQTDHANKSFGSLQTNMFELDGFTQVDQTKLTQRNSKLDRYVKSIAVSPFITPITQYGLMVSTKERITCSIEWKCQEKIVKLVRGKKIASNNTLKPYIDSVNCIYLKNISPKTKKDTLPYKVIYTVTQWDKRSNGNISSDLRITDIKTPHYLSWMPSLALPGLGTYIQGYHSSVVARALPFALFTGLAITSLVWENGKGKEIIRTEWGSGNSRFWENKNFGFITGYVCLAVAGTIYINDLVESIVASRRNIKRTQLLRDTFEKKKYIDLQTQDVKLDKKYSTK